MSNGDGILSGGPPIPHVIDKTGLTGEFEFSLESGGSLVSEDGATVVGRGPSIFSTLEKQLGLKLVKTKASLDVLVIDHVDRAPTEN